MKVCPFCAEEIQDAAIVCKHCGKDLPRAVQAVPRTPKQSSRERLVVTLCVLFGVVVMAAWCASAGTGGDSDTLRISAAFAPSGFQFTNKYQVALRDCRLRVEEADKTTWVASVEHDVAPMATEMIDWSMFQSRGQPMPGSIGRSRSVHITCDVGRGGPRKSAGVRH